MASRGNVPCKAIISIPLRVVRLYGTSILSGSMTMSIILSASPNSLLTHTSATSPVKHQTICSLAREGGSNRPVSVYARQSDCLTAVNNKSMFKADFPRFNYMQDELKHRPYSLQDNCLSRLSFRCVELVRVSLILRKDP